MDSEGSHRGHNHIAAGMKASHLLVYVSTALSACISCVQKADTGHTDGKSLTLSVSVDSGHAVRGTSPGSEDAVNDIQILLFRNGILYAAASSDEEKTDLKVSPGSYSLYAFVNDPADWVSRPDMTEATIRNSVSSFSDNSTSSFVMFGCIPELEADEESATTTVHVDRLMSRIVLENITADFSSNPYYRGCSLQVRNIYMTNVIGTCPYSMTPESAPSSTGIWYNRMGPESCPSSVSSMISDIGLDISIADGTSKDIGRIYYAYPNGCVSDSDSETWQARRCRLAIEAVLDGKECWYHITLPPMEPNASYIISNCTIKNLGGKSPEDNSWPSCEAVITKSVNWDRTFTVEEES